MMIFQKTLVKINIRGGILPSGELIQIIRIARECEVKNTQLGERQNIYFEVEKKHKKKLFHLLKESSLDYEINATQHPNIVSSYAAEDIFTNHPWISEGMYQDILNSFGHRPKLKINIADNTQALSPLFTGTLNFIPSTHLNFYYLYVNHESVGRKWCWSKLIYGNDIAALSLHLETALIGLDKMDIGLLLKSIEQQHKLITMELQEPLQVPRVRFPYYEGMNRFGDKIWLGIYRRNNDFSIGLLESIYKLCTETRIAQINILPWKSIMIKGIGENERIEWEKLLSEHGINSRHSSLELNWQTADLDKQATKIKNGLVKDFDQQDIRTYGLTFAIRTNRDFDTSSSIIVVKRRSIFNFWGIFKFLTIYDILYAPDFNNHATEHNFFATNISWNGLSYYLQMLSQIFYKQLSEKKKISIETAEEKTSTTRMIHQCQHCFTVYDKQIGEPQNKILAGTAFKDLPDRYECPLCENGKEDFKEIEFLNYES